MQKTILKILRVFIFSLVIFSISWIFYYKYHNPFLTYLMVKTHKELKAKGIDRPRVFTWISLQDIPEHVWQAIVWAEDPLFFEHKGVQLGFFVKATKHYLKKKPNDRMTGYSTISHQTAKNVFLYPSRTPLRKILELYFVPLMELIWGKKRILEIYLNMIEYGENVFGIEAASQIYYKKSCKELTIREACLIASILTNPRKLAPNRYQKKVEDKAAILVEQFRRNKLLQEALKRKEQRSV